MKGNQCNCREAINSTSCKTIYQGKINYDGKSDLKSPLNIPDLCKYIKESIWQFDCSKYQDHENRLLLQCRLRQVEPIKSLNFQTTVYTQYTSFNTHLMLQGKLKVITTR